VTAKSGIKWDEPGFCKAVAIGDVDNDGWPDIFCNV
jgi:hypothetical protein